MCECADILYVVKAWVNKLGVFRVLVLFQCMSFYVWMVHCTLHTVLRGHYATVLSFMFGQDKIIPR